ncbi:hypothetical protein GCM10010393_23910 [Streptomyces gobitricini]|uniref:Integral membrane protein n=1 Tax=Streptomyces gobitricini TaxID=68211 RepID=A0ABN3LX36_9ACTN
MGHWFYRNIVEPGKLPLLVALASFVVTFLATRTITRLIRAGKGPFRNVSPGGLHIHHVVPGVVLTLVGGFGGVAVGRHEAGAIVCAVLLGTGAGLVLDEFALILHLDDVYWSEQGRQSVEAVVLTTALLLLVLGGFSPLGVDEVSPEERQGRGGFILSLVLNFLFVLVALFKGKFRMAILGLFLSPVAVFGALRLARPGSLWARRFYRNRPVARAKAGLRAFHHDQRWNRVRRGFQDLIAGAPDRVLPSRHPPDDRSPQPPSVEGSPRPPSVEGSSRPPSDEGPPRPPSGDPPPPDRR